MKKTNMFLTLSFAFTISATALADELVPQRGCGFSSELEGWRVMPPNAYMITAKQVPLETPVVEGDALLYVAFKDAQRVYKTSEEVQFKDKSPLNRDFSAPSGQLFSVAATMKNIADGTTYDIIETEGSFLAKKFFPVRPDGYICSNKIGKVDGRFTLIGMPMVYQGAPLTSTLIEDTQDPATRSVAIVLQRIDGAIAQVQLSLIKNGRQANSVTRGFDIFGGTIDLAGIEIKFKKTGKGLTVLSVSEPGNYYAWIDSVFRDLQGKMPAYR
jgi:hypothetical protein